MRAPVVAGQFYPAGFKELEDQLHACFTHKLGPGALPVAKRSGTIKGVIAPHAGYPFSGPCAAWSFKAIAEAHLQPYLMLGPSHAGSKTCFSDEDWETPLGTVRTDKELVHHLAEQTGIPVDNSSHRREHSIEVQLPFLQFVSKTFLRQLRIVPLMVSHDIDTHTIARKLGKAQCTVICSSDFTHYGLNYGYLPFHGDAKENMYKLDKGAIRHILDMRAGPFLSYVEKTGATICGSLAIGLLLETIHAEKAELLQYYTSGDILNDYSSAVGYAAIVFR